jgi:hypothetical protein
MEPTPLGLGIGAVAAALLAAWTIVAAIVEVARGRSRPWSGDVIAAVVFHGSAAVLALWLASLASNG